MANLFKKGFAVNETDQITLSAKTHGFEIQNMSPFDLTISSPIEGSYRLPAFSAKPFPATPGDVLSFMLVASNFNTAVTVQNQYIQIQESPVSMTGSVIPLAVIPVYTTDVNVQGGNVDIASGTVTATLSGVSQVEFATTQTVDIGNTVATTINSGSVNATIENAQLNTSIVDAQIGSTNLVKLIEKQYTITNLAAGANIGQQAPYASFVGWYDGLIATVTVNNATTNLEFDRNGSNNIGWWNTLGQPQTETWEAYLVNSGDGSGIRYIDFDRPVLLNEFVFTLTNKGSATIASDTATVTIYGIKADMNVANPTNSPVNTSPVKGQPTSASSVNVNATTATKLTTGTGVLQKVIVMVNAGATGSAVADGVTFFVSNNDPTVSGNGSYYMGCVDLSGMTGSYKILQIDLSPGVDCPNGIWGIISQPSGVTGSIAAVTIMAVL